MVWYFIIVYIINKTFITIHDRLEIQYFSSRVEKYFSTHEEKLRIPARSCNILDFLKSILILKILKPLYIDFSNF